MQVRQRTDAVEGRTEQHISAGYRNHWDLIKTENLTSCTVIKIPLSCDSAFRTETIRNAFFHIDLLLLADTIAQKGEAGRDLWTSNG